MPVDLHDPIRQSGSNLCVCGATVDDPVHPTGVAPGVRTHSVHLAFVMGEPRAWLCTSCWSAWPIEAFHPRDCNHVGVPFALDAEPCGTRAPDPGSEAETNG